MYSLYTVCGIFRYYVNSVQANKSVFMYFNEDVCVFAGPCMFSGAASVMEIWTVRTLTDITIPLFRQE